MNTVYVYLNRFGLVILVVREVVICVIKCCLNLQSGQTNYAAQNVLHLS